MQWQWLDDAQEIAEGLVSDCQENGIPDDEYKKAVENITTDLIQGYYHARDTIEKDVETMKNFFKSQSRDLYKTKADVMKEIWRVFEVKSGLKMPPLDEEFLVELAEIPAEDETSFRHPWVSLTRFARGAILRIRKSISSARQSSSDSSTILVFVSLAFLSSSSRH